MNALCVTLELAVNFWHNLADCLSSAGGVLNGVASCGTVVAWLGAAWAVENHLSAGVGVNCGHEAGLDSPVILKQLHHCGHGVGGARTSGNNVVRSLQDFVVRVAGYSAQFISLAKEVQDNIIDRTEFTF